MFRIFSRYSKYLIPLSGILLVFLNWFEGFLQDRRELDDMRSVPSDRPFKVGESDGTFTQVEVVKGSKNDSKPVGVQPTHKTELEGHGVVRPVSSPKNGEPDTQNLINETEKYLRQ